MKAVLVFCEGRHDVVFAQRSLGARGGCTWVDTPIGGLPSPFGSSRSRVVGKGLVARRLEQRALEELSLQDAAHAPAPRFESAVENKDTGTMFLMVNTGSKDQFAAVLKLLQDLDVTIGGEPTGTFEVSEYAAAFLFDANDRGIAATLRSFRERYAAHFGALDNLDHGEWAASDAAPVGCFVFHRSPEDQQGTLEDHLAPMIRQAWPARYAGTERFLDDHREDGHRVSGHEAERLKAIITIVGQFDHPGDPMSVVIGRRGLPGTHYEESPLSAELAGFLASTPWSRP